MSSFSCVIGENNAGKSSLLQAIKKFCEGGAVEETDFNDRNSPIRITAALSEINEEDLGVLTPEQKQKLQPLILNKQLTLIRVFPFGGRSHLLCLKLVPIEEKMRDEWLDQMMSGSGSSLATWVKEQYPELAPVVDSKITQKWVYAEIAKLRSTIPPEAFTYIELPLPTGIPESVNSLLPEPIYIPAVKNLAEDYKTTDTATFGKILALLLRVIEPKFQEQKEMFDQLDRNLNRGIDEHGKMIDERFSEIIQVEQVLQTNLQDNFPEATVEIRISPPTVKSILQNAKIDVFDAGIKGPVETKGDGLKRAVIFSLFRTLADLSSTPGWRRTGSVQAKLVLLFEEPELYLHPKAQKILFEALAEVSKSVQVMVSTHSPAFFSPDKTKTFLKIKKVEKGPVQSFVNGVDLETDLPAKDLFQIVCFENNHAAFFSSTVVFVEGDSDVIALKHIARSLDPKWDFEAGRVMMVRAYGKGNFLRYRTFFDRFGIRSCVLTDLDIFEHDFDKLGIDAQDPIHAEHRKLLEEATKHATRKDLNSDDAKDLLTSYSFAGTWKEIKKIATNVKAGEAADSAALKLVDNLLDEELRRPRLKVLKENTEIAELKHALIAGLRVRDVYVLSKGSIENYYPAEISGKDKLAKAEDFTKKLNTRSQLLTLGVEFKDLQGNSRNELSAIFESVFGTKSEKPAVATAGAFKSN